MYVSVCMTTYNQEKYIGEAIESVLSQQTNFPVQLVIGEDHSTDQTLAICQHFASLYPNILLYRRNDNLGLARNLALTWAQCKGDYIAILEGDDLWCSRSKLQKQVDFLDSHPEYSACFTLANLRDEDRRNNRHRYFPYRTPKQNTLRISDIIRHNLIANCSVMYRAGLVSRIPDWMMGMGCCDLALHCCHAVHGPVGYIPELMSTYRLHSGSSFESKSLKEKVAINVPVYHALSLHLPSPYDKQALQTLLLMNLGLSLWNLWQLPLRYKISEILLPLEELEHLWRVR